MADTHFTAQFEQSRREIRTLKKTVPQMFPEWQRLENAKDRLAEAKIAYDTALKAWKELGRG